MRSKNASFLPITLVALFLAPLLVLVSLPVLNAIHSRLSLPAAPGSALVTLGLALAFAFVGGALIGHFTALFAGRSGRRGLEIAAVLISLFWGGFVALSAAPLYASGVVDAMTRDGSALVWQERAALAASAREIAGRVQRGESRAAAEDAALQAWDKGKGIALRGAAALPASLLLGWALLVPPILGIVAFKKARK